MPTYPMVLAVPAGQTGPLVDSASAYSVPRKIPFRGSSPRWQEFNRLFQPTCKEKNRLELPIFIFFSVFRAKKKPLRRGAKNFWLGRKS